MNKENIIVIKSKAFALRIIELYRFLCENQKEYILSKQNVVLMCNYALRITNYEFLQSL